MRRRERNQYLDAALPVVTAVFWVAALAFVVLMVLYAVTKSVGTTTSWATGISLLLVTVTSGATTWIELRNNPLEDTERGGWTNKMLFYGLACVIGFIIACLYLPALYFAPYGLAGRIARSGATDGEIKREHSKVPERHGDER